MAFGVSLYAVICLELHNLIGKQHNILFIIGLLYQFVQEVIEFGIFNLMFGSQHIGEVKACHKVNLMDEAAGLQRFPWVHLL